MTMTPAPPCREREPMMTVTHTHTHSDDDDDGIDISMKKAFHRKNTFTFHATFMYIGRRNKRTKHIVAIFFLLYTF